MHDLRTVQRSGRYGGELASLRPAHRARQIRGVAAIVGDRGSPMTPP